MIKVTGGCIESALRQSTSPDGSRTEGLDFDFDYALQPNYTIPRFFTLCKWQWPNVNMNISGAVH